MNARILIVAVRMAVLLVAAWGALAADRGSAEIIGNWDFSSGWNSSTGEIAGVAGSNVRLRHLPKTDIYATYKAAYEGSYGALPAAPTIAFGEVESFPIQNVAGRNVLRIPNARGAGQATGLVADFSLATPQKINRYSVIMDVLVTDADVQRIDSSDNYIPLFQPRAGKDGLLFIDKRDQSGGTAPAGDYLFGVAGGYSNGFQRNQWQRIAMVVDLEAAAGPKYMTYLNGVSKAAIAAPGAGRDSDVDGSLSIGTLTDSNPIPNLFDSLPDASKSTFFLFNDNDKDYGSLAIANLQFRDTALSAADILSLGGPTAAAIAVPEPATIVGLASAAVMLACFSSTRSRRAGRGGEMPPADRSGSVAGRPRQTT